MADETGPDQITRNFGFIIAFLLPGFIGLWGISYFDRGVESWIKRASSGPTSIGDFLLVVVASLGIGIFVSGLRCLLFEELNLLKALKAPAKVGQENRGPLSVQREANENFYKFYLFYANTAVAVFVVFVVSLFLPSHEWTLLPKAIALVVSEVILVFSAKDSIKRYREAIRALPMGPEQKTA